MDLNLTFLVIVGAGLTSKLVFKLSHLIIDIDHLHWNRYTFLLIYLIPFLSWKTYGQK